jgi:hypothetical protein
MCPSGHLSKSITQILKGLEMSKGTQCCKEFPISSFQTVGGENGTPEPPRSFAGTTNFCVGDFHLGMPPTFGMDARLVKPFACDAFAAPTQSKFA